MAQLSDFYKNNESDKVWWLDVDEAGTMAFSFDRKKVYYLFQDYPYKLTGEELEIFNAENPYWASFFEDRLQELTAGA